MSRSGYHDDCDGWELIRWRGAVKAALRGARGQRLLRDLVAALDAMPDKRLAYEKLIRDDGCRCAFGVLAAHRGVDAAKLDPEDTEILAQTFDVAEALAREVVCVNDEHCPPARPVQVGGGYQNAAGHQIDYRELLRLSGAERAEYQRVPCSYRPPTPEDEIAVERKRWCVVREWAAGWLREEAQSDQA